MIMLKKLAKYGNSSALVLDKAILELLGIEEGSIVRIKTDGVSIIITPHETAVAEKVSETYTAEQAQIEAMVKQFFKKYKKIDSAQQAKLEKELISLFEKQKTLSNKLFKQPDFMVALQGLQEQKGTSDVHDGKNIEQKLNELKVLYSPELAKVEKEIANFETSNKLCADELSEDQRNQMANDFATMHEKYKDAYAALGKLIDNPEYQHKNQLLAEQFKDNQNSAEYMQASTALRYYFVPELKNQTEELMAIQQKYYSSNQQ